MSRVISIFPLVVRSIMEFYYLTATDAVSAATKKTLKTNRLFDRLIPLPDWLGIFGSCSHRFRSE
jgi:hypothetical protein